MSRSRRIDWAAAQKRGWFAVMGAMCLVGPLALLVLIGLSPGAMAAAATLSASSTAASPAAGATTPASTPSCFPLTESSGTCYNAGEFCPHADLNLSGVAANGTPIACEPEANGTQPHWRDCTPAASAATPASTATGTLVCPAARAGTATTPSTSASATTGTTASATPEVSTAAPVGPPATGGGTGPGINGALAAAGCAVIVAGAGLVFLSRRRRTTGSP